MNVGRLLDDLINCGWWGLDALGPRGLGPARLLGNRLAGRRWKRHHSCRLPHHLLHVRGSHGNYRVLCCPYHHFSLFYFFFHCFRLLLCFLLRALCCCCGFFLPGSLFGSWETLAQRLPTNYSTATSSLISCSGAREMGIRESS